MAKTLLMGPGDVIMKEGDTEKSLYLVSKGKLNVFISEKGRPKKVGEIMPGELVGEMAFVTGEARTATVIAAEETELVKVSGESFTQTLEKLPPWLQQFIHTLVRRIKDHNHA